MNQETNDKICTWAWGSTDSTFDHTRDDDMIHVLPVLAKKGLYPCLAWCGKEGETCLGLSAGWMVLIKGEGGREFETLKPTIAESITSAILSLIEREGKQ